MATNMFPSINPAPLGLDALDVPSTSADIEIEIENPEGLKIGMDGIVIDMLDEPEETFDENLAEVIDTGTLASISTPVKSG